MTGASLGVRGPAADAIEFVRKRVGLSQRTLAVRAGLSQPYVSKLNHGLQPSLLAFARLAQVLHLNPLEVWAAVMTEATAASRGCPRCGGRGEVLLPKGDDLVDHACPLCRPWAEGFPGEHADGRWIIPPYPAGGCGDWHDPGQGPLVEQ